MNGIVLCVFALFAVPSVLAIKCYTCIPDVVSERCTNPTNVTDCDKVPPPPGITFDACAKASIEVAQGETKTAFNAMQCGSKEDCSQMKVRICNETEQLVKLGGLTLEKCELECCEGDKCNGGGKDKDEGSSIVASFIITITSVVVLLSGFFIH